MKHDGMVISQRQGVFTDVKEMYIDQGMRYGRLDEFRSFDQRGSVPDTQLEAMNKEGIDIAVLFPTLGLGALAKEYDDDELTAAISRAYNNWLAEFCATDNTRMYGAAMIPAQHVRAAVEEIKRAKSELGFRAVFLRPNPVRGRNWHNPYYDPIW